MVEVQGEYEEGVRRNPSLNKYRRPSPRAPPAQPTSDRITAAEIEDGLSTGHLKSFLFAGSLPLVRGSPRDVSSADRRRNCLVMFVISFGSSPGGCHVGNAPTRLVELLRRPAMARLPPRLPRYRSPGRGAPPLLLEVLVVSFVNPIPCGQYQLSSQLCPHLSLPGRPRAQKLVVRNCYRPSLPPCRLGGSTTEY